MGYLSPLPPPPPTPTGGKQEGLGSAAASPVCREPPNLAKVKALDQACLAPGGPQSILLTKPTDRSICRP